MKRKFHYLLLLLMIGLLLSSCSLWHSSGASTDRFGEKRTNNLKPTPYMSNSFHTTGGGWNFATPATFGIKEQPLIDFNEKLKQLSVVYSMVLVKNGFIISEYYREGYDEKSQFPINSVTKSVTSALFGIALEEGFVGDIHQPVANWLPLWRRDKDKMNDQVTIKHLLEMTTGMDWPEWSKWGFGMEKMVNSRDWTKFVLERNIIERPGTTFNYNSGASQLLSVIIKQATGYNLEQYGEQKLFKPLGITHYDWETNPENTTPGGFGLEMAPRDMAKFGLLYLQKGKWNGQQLVPKSWVALSTQKHAEGDSWIGGYGFHWWVRDFDGTKSFFAMGYGGQYIVVVPEEQLVIVFTSHFEDTPQPLKLIEQVVAMTKTNSN
ncbi:serine hydrolase domain-containing protein [Paenibacillus sp. 481]|uniref:serine hydrolase domain-containing protein n=1 Tax=Paenibacillus sp. 481 TaxID=2835869 RepID=UPI001E44E528|nr:serine hydrolase [Paenibacillus sp. 481]UHA72278.1 serine hydrolase [Paenibacillus sp. 481]